MTITKSLKDDVALFNRHDIAHMTVRMVREYLTLFIDGKEITSGEVEVKARVKVLNRERGHYYVEG